jgi:hypothetical protein
LLLLCAAVDLDPEIGARCAAAHGEATRPYPTFSLALAHLPDAHWSAIGPGGALRRWRLIEVASGQPLTAAQLRIDETVLHCLTGIAELDRRIASLVLPLPGVELAALAPSYAGLAQRIAAAWETASPLVQLIGESIDCRPIVAAAATTMGLRAAVLTADRIPGNVDEMEDLIRLWGREIFLSGFGVLLADRDGNEITAGGDGHVGRLMERFTGFLALREPERSRIPHRLTATFEVAPMPAAERRQAWRVALRRTARPGDDAMPGAIADAIAAQFRLSQPEIETIVAEASAGQDDIGTMIWGLCRARVRTRLDGLAQRIESRFGWDDLVLPDPEMVTLNTIAAHFRQRTTVYDRWEFAAKSARGLGVSALFSGPSGTGKTMGAEVLANELRLDLYRIDLASVVSKYIGETERNLRRVFDAAEQSGAILLFDEADALFGKRSEVKDSHDRYANIEVSYLLQRMEAYRGLAILTSNMKSALDPAFLRRLRFIVQFPFPDVAQRLRMWRQAFPRATPTEGLDFTGLAQLRVAGGNIRNIAINAAFLAADAGEPVRMPHLLTAARGEYGKLERQLTAAESEAWSR